MGVPLALHVLSGDAGERVVYGDSRGAAVLLLCGSRELPARDLISTETHKVRAESFTLLAGWWGSSRRHEAVPAGAATCRQPHFRVDYTRCSEPGVAKVLLLLHACLVLPPAAVFPPKDYIYLHKEHSDWITKVQWIPELGLVTSSLDATIKTFDINRCDSRPTQHTLVAWAGMPARLGQLRVMPMCPGPPGCSWQGLGLGRRASAAREPICRNVCLVCGSAACVQGAHHAHVHAPHQGGAQLRVVPRVQLLCELRLGARRDRVACERRDGSACSLCVPLFLCLLVGCTA
jgi:hypothetical protein